MIQVNMLEAKTDLSRLVKMLETEIYYSIVSLWEVEIKRLAHPEVMPISAEQLAGMIL